MSYQVTLCGNIWAWKEGIKTAPEELVWIQSEGWERTLAVLLPIFCWFKFQCQSLVAYLILVRTLVHPILYFGWTRKLLEIFPTSPIPQVQQRRNSITWLIFSTGFILSNLVKNHWVWLSCPKFSGLSLEISQESWKWNSASGENRFIKFGCLNQSNSHPNRWAEQNIWLLLGWPSNGKVSCFGQRQFLFSVWKWLIPWRCEGKKLSDSWGVDQVLSMHWKFDG